MPRGPWPRATPHLRRRRRSEHVRRAPRGIGDDHGHRGARLGPRAESLPPPTPDARCPAVAGGTLIAHVAVLPLGMSSNRVTQFVGVSRQSVRRGLRRSEAVLADLRCQPEALLAGILSRPPAPVRHRADRREAGRCVPKVPSSLSPATRSRVPHEGGHACEKRGSLTSENRHCSRSLAA